MSSMSAPRDDGDQPPLRGDGVIVPSEQLDSTQRAAGDLDADEQPAADAAISRLIMAALTLRDVEVLLYVHGRRFRSRHVAQLLARLPAVEVQGANASARRSRVVGLMCQGLMDTCAELGGPPLAACLWALGRLNDPLTPPATLPAVLEELMRDGCAKACACTFAQLADVTWAAAKLQAGAPGNGAAPGAADRAWHAIARVAPHMAPQATADDLARMAWAFAKAGQTDASALFASIAAQAVDLCRRYPPPSGPSIMVGRGSPLAAAAAARATAAVDGGTSSSSSSSARLPSTSQVQQLALSSEVSLRVQRADLGGLVVPTSRVRSHDRGLTPSAITNLAWAFAVVGHRDERLFAALAEAAVPQKAAFNPASLATLAWAFAAFDHHHEDLMVAIAKKACRRMRYFSGEQLSQLMWAFAALRHNDATLMDRVKAGLQTITASGSRLRPHEACNLLWAVTRLQPHGKPKGPPSTPRHAAAKGASSVMQLLLPALLQRAPGSLGPNDLTNAVWALGVAAAARPAAALAAASSGSLSAGSSGRHEEASSMQEAAAGGGSGVRVWSLLPGLLHDLSLVPASSFSTDDLARLHAADLLLRHTLRTAAAHALRRTAEHGGDLLAGGAHGISSAVGELVRVGDNEVLDVSQFRLPGALPDAGVPWFEDHSASLLPEHLSQAAAAAAHEAAMRQQRASGGGTTSARGGGPGTAWLLDVVLTLEDMGCEPASGIPVLGGACLADLAIMSSVDKLAVQRDGPECFSRSLPHTELGEAVIERRLLQLAGWQVIPVPRHLWELWEGREEQLMFLHSMLAESGAEVATR